MSYADIWKKAQAEQAGAKERKPQRHEESRLQESCVTWFRLQYPKLALLLFAVPNGGKRTHRTIVRAGRVITYSPEAKQMKKEGVTAGVADLILLKPSGGYASLCIEMKTTEKWSEQRESQKIWQQAAEEAGNKYVVCRTLEGFISVVNDYLKPANNSE
jgi:hypothetical protein